MRNKVFKVISFYINWWITNYHAIVKINANIPALRLISEDKDEKTGKVRFKIQISGKNIFPILSLEDIKNPTIISNFCKRDQKIIFNYLLNKDQRFQYRIVARTYNREVKKFYFTIEYVDTTLNIKRYKVIDSLSSLIDELKNFDSEDMLLISAESK